MPTKTQRKYEITSAEWAPGAQVGDTDAMKVARWYETLAKQHGETPTTETILVAASSRTAPIHHLLEWDNEKCGMLYRLNQIRHITNHLVVHTRIVGDGDRTPHKMFVNIRNAADDSRVYANTVTLMDEKEYRARMLAQALSELEQWCARWNMLRALGGARRWIRNFVKGMIPDD